MKTWTSQVNHRIQWTGWMQLYDLDFADDIAVLSHTPTNAYGAAASVSVGINIHKGKSTSSNTTQRTPTQSYLMEKLWERWKHSHTWSAAASMNKKDSM
ncbi:unnamed protein product [Schistosoma margrebowiei]|uniref:Uncharacterized protein n=1 Tax=Schistosoma margrebowiei TaxID=48269 RepID=A0A183MJB7_9TREM|nr:unnamed protein product [Schistosoma margrebowiei]